MQMVSLPSAHVVGSDFGIFKIAQIQISVLLLLLRHEVMMQCLLDMLVFQFVCIAFKFLHNGFDFPTFLPSNASTISRLHHTGAHRQEECVSCCSARRSRRVNWIMQNSLTLVLFIYTYLGAYIESFVLARWKRPCSLSAHPGGSLSFSYHPSSRRHPLPAFAGWALWEWCHLNSNADSKGGAGGAY